MKNIVKLGIACGLLVSACQVSRFDDSGSELRESEWEKRRWIEKASRLLRAGRSASSAEMQQWVSLAKPEIVDRLTTGPEFADMALNFNLYFLGSRPMSLREYDRRWQVDLYTREIFTEPSAIQSARELLRGGDYLKLLDWEQPVFLPPVTRSQETRDAAWAEIDSAYAQAMELFREQPQDLAAACQQLRDNDLRGVIRDKMKEAGFGKELPRVVSEHLRSLLLHRCHRRTVDEIRTSLRSLREATAALFEVAGGMSAENYALADVGEIKTLDELNLPVSFPGSRFGITGFWDEHQNSSTNFNRKRAKYMLKTFFCDDLTPITLPAVDHAEGQHATDPGCQACHYRLDPMGGLFRYRGSHGRIYDNGYLYFDDNVSIEDEAYDQYMATWRDASGEREWNIGLVQSTHNRAMNHYLDRIEDLFPDFRREVPRLNVEVQPRSLVNRCLTKRLAEFVLGPQQATDGAWLAGLSTEFVINPNSSSAFKNTVKRLVLSETFAQADPDPEQCYDEAADASQVPCQVRSQIEESCARCHSRSGRGRINLNAWSGNAESGNFDHQDDQGNPRSRQETFTAIYCRVQSNDRTRLMPPGGMLASDRATLITWLSEQIGTPDCGQGQGGEP